MVTRKDKIKVISTFTGIGGFELAMANINQELEMQLFNLVAYSEIDKKAAKVFEKRFLLLQAENLGDIETASFGHVGNVDLLVGGSPCQDLSIAKGKGRQGLAGEKSRLFYAWLRILEEKRPRFFILENVASMSSSSRDKITEEIARVTEGEVYLTLINSSLVTAQNRNRYYWTNFPVSQPEDLGIKIEGLTAWSRSTRYPEGKEPYWEDRTRSDGKANTLTTGAGCGSFSSKNFLNGDQLTPEICEELQGFPRGWTNVEGNSLSQRYKQIGNAVTVPVIEHILRELIKNF